MPRRARSLVRQKLLPTLSAGFAFGIVALASQPASAKGLKTLYSFCAQTNCTDGSGPSAGLAEVKGHFFGTTSGGGTANKGTVFELVKTSRGFVTRPLVSFHGTTGAAPLAEVAADRHGNLFGTTSAGGANGHGEVFEIVKTSKGFASAPTVLYSFCAQTNCTDGADPQAALLVDRDGNLFGTTVAGGEHSGGTVFEIPAP
jgi:uncharacterized repeat protein (TIGR03803 family)